jgi:RecJ-like exonuclease
MESGGSGMTGRCDRCGKETNTHIMSMFNTESVCPKCKKKEEEHPMYNAAREAELEAVKAGLYNFPGIGKPRGL